MPTSSTCNSISRAVTDRSPRSTSCSKTRMTSSEPGPRAAQRRKKWGRVLTSKAFASEAFDISSTERRCDFENVHSRLTHDLQITRSHHQEKRKDFVKKGAEIYAKA